MTLDAMGAIKLATERYRTDTTYALILGGHDIPETEQDWLKFRLNQQLRDNGAGKPLPEYDSPSQGEFDHRLMQAETFRATGRLFGLRHA